MIYLFTFHTGDCEGEHWTSTGEGSKKLGMSEANRFDECGDQVRVSGDVNKDLLQAIDLALSGQWNAAHKLVQQYEDTTAAWIHAVLHKIEGARDNSRYWYRRAGKLEHFSDEPKEELAEIRKEVAGQK